MLSLSALFSSFSCLIAVQLSCSWSRSAFNSTFCCSSDRSVWTLFTSLSCIYRIQTEYNANFCSIAIILNVKSLKYKNSMSWKSKKKAALCLWYQSDIIDLIDWYSRNHGVPINQLINQPINQYIYSAIRVQWSYNLDRNMVINRMSTHSFMHNSQCNCLVPLTDARSLTR